MSDQVSPTAAPHPSFPAWKRWFIPPFVVALVLDQMSKRWLFSLPDDTRFPSWIEPVRNTGVAWSIGSSAPLLVALVTLILIPVLAWFYWRHFRRLGGWENLAFGLILGGALGNAYDRLIGDGSGSHGVRDFIKIDLNNIGIPYVWPIFNVADMAISGGFIILLYLSMCDRTRRRTASSP
jgi:lipoprotein signal peptidase